MLFNDKVELFSTKEKHFEWKILGNSADTSFQREENAEEISASPRIEQFLMKLVLKMKAKLRRLVSNAKREV